MGFDPSAYACPGVTQQEVMDMKAAFDMIDEDESGSIDAEELQGAAVALGIPMEENITLLLGDKKINFDEFFQRMTSEAGSEDKVDHIMNIFELFDQGSKGTISQADLTNVARLIGAKESEQVVQDMLSTLDTDGDGELDPIDFYTCLVSGMRLRLDKEAKARQAEREGQSRR